MGNANSQHTNERRKSTSGDSPGRGGVYNDRALAHHNERTRRFSGSGGPQSPPPSINYVERQQSVGPVDITPKGGGAAGGTNKTPNKLLQQVTSHFRPRAGTADAATARPRPRAQTVSAGHCPGSGRQRHPTVDTPNQHTHTAAASGGHQGAVVSERVRKHGAAGGDGGGVNRAGSPTESNESVEGGEGTGKDPAMGEDGSNQVSPAGDANKQLPTIFKYAAPQGTKEVFISGTFNNWQKLRMCPSTKDFIAIVDLNEGTHEYKFCVDGEWMHNPNEPTTTPGGGDSDRSSPTRKNTAPPQSAPPQGTENNNFPPKSSGKSSVGGGGGGNSNKNNVIRVQKEDFDAYHALDMDSKAVAAAQQKQKKFGTDNFSQEIPGYVSQSDYRSGPPILPPHLNQVILNKDTPLSCEPTLLPEPKHVMLNHLYALSIKDGVMVLSSTQRFKQKYVTTLLYKPMGVRKTA